MNRRIPWTFLNLCKIVCTVGLVSISIADLCLVSTNDNDDAIDDVDYVTSVVFLLSFLYSLLLLLLSIQYGIRTSPTQSFFYLGKNAPVAVLSILQTQKNKIALIYFLKINLPVQAS